MNQAQKRPEPTTAGREQQRAGLRLAGVAPGRGTGTTGPTPSNLALQGLPQAPIQRLRIRDDNAMATGDDPGFRDLSVDEVIALLRDNLHRFDYRYQDYIQEDVVLRPIVEFLEASFEGGEISSDELFGQVELGLGQEVPKLLETALRDSDSLPELAVDLPDLQPTPGLPLGELERQLAGQVDAINELSVADWLRNVLLNRLKSVDAVVSQSHGTKGGLALAQWLNQQLLSNDELARFAMQAVVRNIETLSLQSDDYAGSPLMAQLLDAALVSQAMDDGVFATFESLGGIAVLEELNRAGLEGGLGRQHGTGDERWFREQFLSGVELLRQEDVATFGSNAVLHNPDQCAGGDMAICSGGELVELTEARDRFLRARHELAGLRRRIDEGEAKLERLRGTLANYDERLPGLQAGSFFFGAPPTRQELEAQIAALEAELGELETTQAEVEQVSDTAEEQYRDALRPHLGNRAVNSFLGRQWMEPQAGLGGRGRTEHLIRQAVALLEATDIETLERTQMDVGLDIDPEARAGRLFDDAMRLASDDEADLAEDVEPGAHEAPTKRIRLGGRRSRGRRGAGGLSKGKKAVLAKGSVDRSGKQRTLDAVRIGRRDTTGLRETLAGLRTVCRIGHASGVGMNCLIRAVLRAAGRADDAATVRAIRRNAWALGLVGDEEMFDLDEGGGAAVLQQIQGLLGAGFVLNVLQVNPQNGRVLAVDQIAVGGGGPDLYILHLGAHFSPLYPTGGLAGWLAAQVAGGAQNVQSTL